MASERRIVAVRQLKLRHFRLYLLLEFVQLALDLIIDCSHLVEVYIAFIVREARMDIAHHELVLFRFLRFRLHQLLNLRLVSIQQLVC